jgi:hypothetical protein
MKVSVIDADFVRGADYAVLAEAAATFKGLIRPGYDTVGYPFMQHLGEVILKYEQARKRKYPPNLTKFALSY